MNTEQTSKNIFTYISFWKPFFYIQRLHSACSTKDDISINVTSKTGLVWNKRQGKLVTVFNWLVTNLEEKILAKEMECCDNYGFPGIFLVLFLMIFQVIQLFSDFQKSKETENATFTKKTTTKQNKTKQTEAN